MQTWRCSNKSCNWNKSSSLVQQLSGTMHIDLVKLQTEHGANGSYRKAATGLAHTTGKRRINNHTRIRRITNAVGNILAEHSLTDEGQILETTEAFSKCFSQGKGDITNDLPHTQLEEGHLDFPEGSDKVATESLCAAVDGGHVHDANSPGKNFEVMMGKVFNPNNIVRLDKHHTKITKKHCAGSGKYDKQKTMKTNLVKAANAEGIDKKKTKVVALADGAKNCWNVIEVLEPLCLLMVCILDWFHIGKYIKRVKVKLPCLKSQLDEIKSLLWHGHVKKALTKIKTLLNSVTDKEHLRVINNFHKYIFENQKYIVDYGERRDKGLPYTSHVAESTVEHLLNDRCKRKQKMQWSRDGIHAVIQIRVSQASDDWDNDWENIIKPKYLEAA